MKRSFIQKRHWILLFGIIPPLLIILVLAVVLFFVPPNSEIMMEKTQVGWNLVIALLVSLLCAISSIYYWRNHAVTPQQSLSVRLYSEGVDEIDYHLIERLFRGSYEVRLYPLTGGFSGTLVFRVDYRDQQGERLSKVLKLGPGEKIKREEENYIDFVRDSILGVRMSKCEYEKGRGAALYTFANMSRRETVTFEELFSDAECNIDDVVMVIREVFLNTLQPWLSGAQTSRTSYLYRTYDLAQDWSKICQGVNDLGLDPDAHYFDCLGRRFPNPLKQALKWFEARADSPIYTKHAIVHGDLNSRNILIDGNQNVFVIDFAKTRRDHFLRDFCKLEAEIMFCLIQMPADDTEHVIALAEALLLDENGEPFEYLRDLLQVNVVENTALHLERAWRSIRALREIASQAIGPSRVELEAEQYYLGLLHHTLDTLRYEQCDRHSKQHALISASLLCRALHKGNSQHRAHF